MSISKGIGGDNTLTISARTLVNQFRPVIEVIEYSPSDEPVVHYCGNDMPDAIRKANDLLADEAKVAQIEHERFSYVEVSDALFPGLEMWKRRYDEEVKKVKNLKDELMKLNGRQLYMVNYTVTNTFTAYVEATSPEDAQHVVEEIYQNNYDRLPEDGDLDHEIELGIPVDRSEVWDYDEILSIEDAN